MEYKYKKTYELKQIIKAYAKWASTHKFTRKLECDDKWYAIQKESWEEYIKLLRKYNYAVYNSWEEKYGEGYNIRLFYVAYGMLRKKPYPIIERPRKENELSKSEWEIIKEITDKFTEVEIEKEVEHV